MDSKSFRVVTTVAVVAASLFVTSVPANGADSGRNKKAAATIEEKVPDPRLQSASEIGLATPEQDAAMFQIARMQGASTRSKLIVVPGSSAIDDPKTGTAMLAAWDGTSQVTAVGSTVTLHAYRVSDGSLYVDAFPPVGPLEYLKPVEVASKSFTVALDGTVTALGEGARQSVVSVAAGQLYEGAQSPTVAASSANEVAGRSEFQLVSDRSPKKAKFTQLVVDCQFGVTWPVWRWIDIFGGVDTMYSWDYVNCSLPGTAWDTVYTSGWFHGGHIASSAKAETLSLWPYGYVDMNERYSSCTLGTSDYYWTQQDAITFIPGIPNGPGVGFHLSPSHEVWCW